MFPDTAAMNIFVVYRVRGPLDTRVLADALATLHARHPTLRSSFAGLVAKPVDVPFALVHERVAAADLDRALQRSLRTKLSVDDGRLWEARLLSLPGEHYLAITI